jgi:DNA recombination protein RmuC
MEFLFPLSMLGVGLIIGAVSLWFITRSKLKYEFERGRAAATSEHATLIERLAGKDDQVRQLREALDRETATTEDLRHENSRNAAQLSALQTRLEDERRINQEKLALLSNAEEKLADAFKALSADALRNNNQSFLDLARQNLEKFQETARGDLEKRQSAIDEMVKPLK